MSLKQKKILLLFQMIYVNWTALIENLPKTHKLNAKYKKKKLKYFRAIFLIAIFIDTKPIFHFVCPTQHIFLRMRTKNEKFTFNVHCTFVTFECVSCCKRFYFFYFVYFALCSAVVILPPSHSFFLYRCWSLPCLFFYLCIIFFLSLIWNCAKSEWFLSFCFVRFLLQ